MNKKIDDLKNTVNINKLLRLIIFFICIFANKFAAANETYMNSVSQVRVSTYSYDFKNPWQLGADSGATGSAVLVDKEMLLTNAHVIRNAMRIEVKRGDANRWYKAKVKHVSDAVDLAVLVVDDKSFYKGAESVKIGTHVEFGSEVTVVGFPGGGDFASITKGVLSRTEITSYSYSMLSNLTYQVDAAINSGNSGGAVFSSGKLIGIAFQASENLENTGYVIPIPVINQFFVDIQDGRVDGVPLLPMTTSIIINPTLQEYFGIGNKTGALITGITGPPEESCVLTGDVVVGIENYNIQPDGVIQVDGIGSVNLEYISKHKQIGDSVALDVFRKGKNIKVNCELQWTWDSVWLVAPVDHQYRPKWLELGGLIIVEVTDEFYDYANNNEISLDGMVTDSQIKLQPASKENLKRMLIVTNKLDHDKNTGYDVTSLVVSHFNEIEIKNLENLRSLLNINKSPWVKIGFHNGEFIVFKANELEIISANLKETYGY